MRRAGSARPQERVRSRQGWGQGYARERLDFGGEGVPRERAYQGWQEGKKGVKVSEEGPVEGSVHLRREEEKRGRRFGEATTTTTNTSKAQGICDNKEQRQ